MIDREKVIKGLDICANGGGCKDGIPNPLCPYSSVVGCDLNQILLDALALLKEQEAPSVLSNRVCEAEPLRYVRKGFCPKCHQEMEWLFNRKYCGFCGQEVNWK